MKKRSVGDRACCPSRIKGITYLKIGPSRDIMVGMTDLDTIFQQLYSIGRRPEEATDEELVDMARRSNYIPDRPQWEAYYATALREAYARFIDRQENRNERFQR